MLAPAPLPWLSRHSPHGPTYAVTDQVRAPIPPEPISPLARGRPRWPGLSHWTTVAPPAGSLNGIAAASSPRAEYAVILVTGSCSGTAKATYRIPYTETGCSLSTVPSESWTVT